MTGGWDRERRARELIARRGEFLERLPREIAAARALSDDARELAVDEAIEYVAVDHKRPLRNGEQLEQTFWASCALRVRRALEGRHDTVRAGWQRADEATLAALPADDEPVEEVLRREDARLAIDFAATLAQGERAVLACKFAHKKQGYRQIARQLDVDVGAVRAAELAIEHKSKRFAAIVTAGRLCGYRTPIVASLAAGAASEDEALAARAHLAYCRPCAAAYTRHVRYLQSAAFQRKVAALLPVPAATSERLRLTGGLRDIVADWLARLFGHDPAATATQLAASGAGRGAGTAALLKLAAVLCVTGAGATCVQSGLVPNPLAQHDKPATQPTRKTAEGDRRGKSAAARRASRPARRVSATPTATPPPKRTQRTRTAPSQTTQGASGPTSHEQAPASPAPPNAAPNGASEFDPSYQPSQPAQPAPVPAAPGANEFF